MAVVRAPPACEMPGKGPATMDSVRFAVVGTSAIADSMIETLRADEGATYVGSMSRSAERAASTTERWGGSQAFTSVDEICACNEVDAVYIASPNAFHVDQALACIRAGKHVLVEKPIAPNAVQARMLFEAGREHGVVVMEAMRSVHDPGMDVIVRAMERIGRVRRASLRFGKYSSRYDEVLAGRQTNIFDARMASGSLMDIGVYCVEAMVYLFGAPDAVLCGSVPISTPMTAETGGLIDGAGTIVACYADKVVELAYSKISTDLLPCQIEGELGTITYGGASIPNHGTLWLRGAAATTAGYSAAQGENDVTEELVFDPCANNMCYEVRDFVDIVHGGGDATRYRGITLASLDIMDEARRQAGIVFPADTQAS